MWALKGTSQKLQKMTFIIQSVPSTDYVKAEYATTTVTPDSQPPEWVKPVAIVGSVAAVIAAALIVFCLWKRRQRRRKDACKKGRQVESDDVCSMMPPSGTSGTCPVILDLAFQHTGSKSFHFITLQFLLQSCERK